MPTFMPDEEDSVYIGHGAELTGAVRARDSIVIDGTFDGELSCNHLVVGQNGVLKGIVNVSTADISGHVSAEIATRQLLAVRSTGRVEGKWNCGAIEVARGAVLNGAAHVTEATVSQRRAIETVEPAPEAAEEIRAPAIAAIAPLQETRRITKLALRTPRRSVG